MESNDKRRAVVDVDGVRPVLLQEFMGDVYAVSNGVRIWDCSCKGRRLC